MKRLCAIARNEDPAIAQTAIAQQQAVNYTHRYGGEFSFFGGREGRGSYVNSK